jgi:tRNA threonylcarbamoyladenosine biosynthesis protein TsaB
MTSSPLPSGASKMFLGIDTSTRWLNLALLSAEGGVLAEFRESLPTHTTRLAPEIRNLLERGRVLPKDLTALGVVVGPGSFTGLRVGLAAAAGLSQALEIPAYGLSSLEALALACPASGPGIALLDARRGEVYVQLFEKSGAQVRALGQPAALSPVAIPMGECIWAIGDGVSMVQDWPADCARFAEIPNLSLPAAHRALELASRQAPSGPLQALYVRAPDVREPRV